MNLRIVFLLVALSGVGCASSKSHSNPTRDYIANTRLDEIRRQAPMIGIPVDRALAVGVRDIHLCPETGSNADGSFTCNDCTDGTRDCVHAWFRDHGAGKRAEYMFATPTIKTGTIAHEVHHELCVIFYGIGGHPAKSSITRIDNGQKMTITHGSVIGWRWPQLINWALPESWEIGSGWRDAVQCGTDEWFENGGGI